MKKVKAYSLLEITIYLAIVGILMFSISKGINILYQAKLHSTSIQIISIRMQHSINLMNNHENILLEKFEKPAIGGIFLIENKNDNLLLILCKNEKKEGILTQIEAKNLKNKLNNDINIIEKQSSNGLYIIECKL